MSTIFNFSIACGIGIIIFMLIPLFKTKKKTIQDKLLISILVVIFNFLAIVYTNTNDLTILTLFFLVFTDPIEFILGPLIYVYVKSLISNPDKIVKKYLKHFVPAVVYLLVITLPKILSYLKGNYLFDYVAFVDNENEKILPVLFMLYLNIYILLSLKSFTQYQSQLKNQFSTIHKHKSIWIKRMLTGILVVCFIDLLMMIGNLVFNFKIDISEFATPLASVILVYYLGYNAINKTKLLIPYDEQTENIATKNATHQTITFGESEINKYKKLIHQYLEIEQLYLNEDLNLLLLSKKIGMSDKKLSAYINHVLNTTFYDLINHYRINAIKQKLSNPRCNDMTIIAIANDCGFKSKTTFNRIFKKETGMLPSVYKKTYQKSLQMSTVASIETFDTEENS
ncbi:helix-turn-helix domain-containing protein [Wenyingzhuangia sp. IMCC45533]